MADVEINVKYNMVGVERKLSVRNIELGNLAIRSQFLLEADRFVPKRQGNLRANGYTTSTGVSYDMVYARAQFYGFVTGKDKQRHEVKNYTTRNTSKRWDLRTMNNAKSYKAIKNALVKAMEVEP